MRTPSGVRGPWHLCQKTLCQLTRTKLGSKPSKFMIKSPTSRREWDQTHPEGCDIATFHPSAAESVSAPIPPSTPTTPDGADLAPVHQGDGPIRSRAPDTSPRAGDSNVRGSAVTGRGKTELLRVPISYNPLAYTSAHTHPFLQKRPGARPTGGQHSDSTVAL